MPLANSSCNVFSSQQALSSTTRSMTGQRSQPVSAMREIEKNVATTENVDSFPSLRILEVLGVGQVPSKFVQEPAVVVKQSNMECVPTMSNIIAVAEFKGPEVHGVVRFEQGGGDGEDCSIEANIDGLSPGKHGWGVHEFGDLTRGAQSTGPAYTFHGADSDVDFVMQVEGLGNLGSLNVNSNGHVQSAGNNRHILVSDIIGRSVVLYGRDGDDGRTRVAAAVIARSARPSSLSPQLCHCDGSFMWQGGNSNNGCS